MSIVTIALGMYLMHKQAAIASEHSQISKEMDDIIGPNMPPVEIIGDRINYGRADDINGRRTMVVARDDMFTVNEKMRKEMMENQAMNNRYQRILYDKQISGHYFNGQMRFFNPMYNDTSRIPVKNVTDLMQVDMSSIDMKNMMNSNYFNGQVIKT